MVAARDGINEMATMMRKVCSFPYCIAAKQRYTLSSPFQD